MSETWDEVRSNARESLVEALTYEKDMLRSQNFDAGDLLHEVADGAIPVYNHDIMSVAAHPDVWSADVDDFGKPENLIQAAQWSIYAALQEYLNGELDAIIEAITSEAEAQG